MLDPMTRPTQFQKGETVSAFDGMISDRALILSDPLQHLTSGEWMFHIRFLDDSEEYVCYAADLTKLS